MKYYRFRIRTTPACEDAVIDEMRALGFEGAQIEDNVPLTAAEKEQIYTYDVDDPVDDGIAYVSFYTEADARISAEHLRSEIGEALQRLRARGAEVGDGTLDISVLDDSDWKDNWKQFFHRFFIDDILVVPSWETPDENDMKKARYVLHIDPGTAFGTGAHETTQLAIRAIRKETMRLLAEKKKPHMLDIGTGSGVLGILALMFGAADVTATDLDPFTEEAVAQNLAANGLDPGRFHLLLGNIIDNPSVQARVLELSADNSGYDIVAANILPVVLTPLAPVVPRFLKPGGVYITSGILCEREEEMRGVLEAAGMVVTEVTREGEWCALRAVKAQRQVLQ